MKKVLITGGAGFIGSNLCNFLLKKNFDITVFDNLSSGKLSNIPKKIKFFKIDIRN
jgi:UDP-glucose 4-epimerase